MEAAKTHELHQFKVIAGDKAAGLDPSASTRLHQHSFILPLLTLAVRHRCRG